MTKKEVSCKYNQECWMKVRLPKIREAKRQGISVYLPYRCSFAQMGDLENCSLRDRFAREHNEGVEKVELPAEGFSGNDI